MPAKKIGYGKQHTQKNKLAARSLRAVWVGQVGRTGEHIVIKPNSGRTVRRVPIEDRWSAEDILNVKATPRHPTQSLRDKSELQAKLVDEEANVEHRARTDRSRDIAERRRNAAVDEDSGANLRQPQIQEPREEGVRRFKITESLLDKYGYTDGCEQCRRKLAGISDSMPGRRIHTEACQTRLQNVMMEDEKGKSSLSSMTSG